MFCHKDAKSLEKPFIKVFFSYATCRMGPVFEDVQYVSAPVHVVLEEFIYPINQAEFIPMSAAEKPVSRKWEYPGISFTLESQAFE